MTSMGRDQSFWACAIATAHKEGVFFQHARYSYQAV